MAEVMVSVATGVMTSVVQKLTILLGHQYNLANNVRREISFMKDELSSMNAALQRLADVDDDQINVQTIEWRSKVRELSYDIEDCVNRFMLLHGSNKKKKKFVQKIRRKISALWGDRQIAKEIQDLKARVIEEKERRDRYNVDQYINMPYHVHLDPRAQTLYEEARDLVGIDGPREQIIGWLKDEERQLKVMSIFGIGGQGKTTLAMEAYRKTEEPFDCRASVTVSRTLDIKKLLRDVLFQINRTEYDRSERWDTEQLIPTLREYLMDKRYLIIIDDIWSILHWEYVKSAFPDNNNQSRIITTTRIKDVAQSCCSGNEGHIYEAKPLNEEDSYRLFFRRIFCSTEECPHELREVANDILRKCAGLPLAIISIAGLLANKSQTVDVWIKVWNSVSCAAEKDSLVDKMKRILFLSYFDLPHYLKTCLLYLSIFPEDYQIDCRDLVRRWVAEGLIPGRNRESMELLGESYLHELINRSMVQPNKIGVDGTVKVCTVHDVVLDFIISQSVKDNFVAILNDNASHPNFSNKIRRLCLQSDFSEAADVAKAVVNNISHLRSFYLIISDEEEMGTPVSHLLKSQVLQVLSIQGASTWGCHPERIGSFSRLKYLRIGRKVVISKIPEEIGNLQHLEILDVRENRGISELPASIVQLQKLVCLFIHYHVKLPSGIGNLQALEELSEIGLYRASVECTHELGELTKLKALGIYGPPLTTEGQREALMSSLSKLVTRSLRSLHLCDWADSGVINSWIVSCGSTTQLRKLVLFNCFWDSIPSRIGSLVNLTRLRYEVYGELGEEGIKTLASLPMLLSLTVDLETEGVIHPTHVIGQQGFQRLLKFSFYCCRAGALVFESGAMPKLQRLKLSLQSKPKYRNRRLVVGLPHLLGLKHITVFNHCGNAVTEEVDALENGIRDAAETLPNCPVVEITRI